MKRKAALHNLGCKVNAYETEAMQQMLEKAGYEIVPFTEYADVYVINTCSVTNIADRKSRQMLHRAKKENPKSIVVAAGCYVQTSAQEAAKDEAVDIIIGNNRKNELVEILEKYMRDREAQMPLNEAERKSGIYVRDINAGREEYESLSLSKTSEHTRAFLKVQDGCNQFCSYCIIPYARGRIRSPRIREVVGELTALEKSGCREVVLTGIHLSSYGLDHGEDLLELILAVHEIKGIKRIRLGSLEPNIVTEEFVRTLSGMKKVCPHFHLSLQSGCDATLERMNRKYDTRIFEEKCRILRKYYRHPAITTDVIVGFPGETEEEFAQTKEFLAAIRFYEMHIFKYSKREGTKAAKMEAQVPEEIKAKRSAILLEMAKEMSEEFRKYYLGKEETVLLEEKMEYNGRTYFTGYTAEYIKIAVETAENLENHIVKGKISDKLNKEMYLMVEISDNLY